MPKPPKPVPPTYTPARMPTGVSLPVCSSCGAVVLDQTTHDDWHTEQDKPGAGP